MNKLCDIGDTENCAEKIVREFLAERHPAHATMLGLSGELGSGKTVFVKALAKRLGVSDTVLSPTFVIEKIYKLPPGKPFRHLIHIDAYRIDNEEELRVLGWDELLADPHNLIVIEWPERIKGLLPKDAREIKFKHVNETTREISW